MSETATSTRLIMEYTQLQEDEQGYCQAINFETFGVAETGAAELFESEDEAVACFIDYVLDQWQALEAEEDPSYMGWGRVVMVTHEDGTPLPYTLRISEHEGEIEAE